MNQLRTLVILFAILGIAMLCGAAGLFFQKMFLLIPKIDDLSIVSFGITGFFFLIVALVIKKQVVI